MRRLLIHILSIILATVLLLLLLGGIRIAHAKVLIWANSGANQGIDISKYPADVQMKYYLYTNLLDQGFNTLDFYILRDIIECESHWRHYDTDGATVLQNYNGGSDFGVAQINSPTWDEHLAELGIDMWTPEGNLDGTIYIYENYGPEQWACF